MIVSNGLNAAETMGSKAKLNEKIDLALSKILKAEMHEDGISTIETDSTQTQHWDELITDMSRLIMKMLVQSKPKKR